VTTTPTPAAVHQPEAGIYRLPGDRRVHYHWKPSDSGWDREWHFYREGDDVVPLTPQDGGMFASEGGEAIQLSAAARVDDYITEEVRFPSAELRLSGTLVRRPGRGRRPAMVMLHGTFPAQRHFYRLWGDAFLDHGIAILVFDKRGFGASEGNRGSSILERAADAEAAVTFLGSHSAVDPGRIGLWGFSNSTWSLPVVGARLKERLAFLIAIGSAGVTMGRAETHRKVWELRRQGVPGSVLADVGSAWGIIYAHVSGAAWQKGWDAELPALLERIHAAPELAEVEAPGFVKENPFLASVPPSFSLPELKGLGRLAPDMGRDPALDYEGVTCPVLFLIGERDANLPAYECASAIRAALERGGNRDHTITIYPDAGHMMNVVVPGVAELDGAQLHAFRFAPDFLEQMTGWAEARVVEKRT
jgi:uncharacterized protein